MHTKFSRRIIAKSIAAKLLAEPSRQKHWLQVLAAYLLEQNMVDDMDLLVNDIAREIYTQNGHLYVDVSSARPLNDAARRELTHMLALATGARHVEIEARIDKTLLGGLVARTPDGQFDASVRSKLKQLASIS
jgi:F-type H+-transporting ATPase subunit delta